MGGLKWWGGKKPNTVGKKPAEEEIGNVLTRDIQVGRRTTELGGGKE